MAEIKFLCDFMLGKLAKYLRMLGFDTKYEKETNKVKMEFVAKTENRIIITRNSSYKEKENCLFLNTDNPKEQLLIILNKLNLYDKIKLASRCLLCNEVVKKIEKKDVKGKVPYYVYQTKNEFSYCPICQRIYWAGTHYKNMEEFLEKIKNAGGRSRTGTDF
ncbi:MAG: Mut7-C RNAse domain-containing protein [candidate division WOR-3 bacterium]|nr:Mut7-C RNAse domain-containing protein [candidate division WOR-3 bacterium]MCX7836361.1 Mut7-C RNAse domain-containing protein [candidate division WOR-3 bacterium]MDW8113534.1 Mut7-C RNAse domain-containing protein [candidate division WOR-3 bacterium]